MKSLQWWSGFLFGSTRYAIGSPTMCCHTECCNCGPEYPESFGLGRMPAVRKDTLKRWTDGPEAHHALLAYRRHYWPFAPQSQKSEQNEKRVRRPTLARYRAKMA